MKEKIVEILFFISLCSFCIQGSFIITIIGMIVFCSCGLYVVLYPERFITQEQIFERNDSNQNKNKHRNAA